MRIQPLRGLKYTKSQKSVMMKGSDLEHYDLNLLAQDGPRDVKVTSIPKGHAAFIFEEDQKPYVEGSHTKVFVLELAAHRARLEAN